LTYAIDSTLADYITGDDATMRWEILKLIYLNLADVDGTANITAETDTLE